MLKALSTFVGNTPAVPATIVGLAASRQGHVIKFNLRESVPSLKLK